MDNPALNISDEKKEAPPDNGVTAIPAPETPVKQMDISPSRAEFKMTKFQIVKNLLVVSFGFLFLFTAFQSLSNLQSSLNRSEGLGTIGLSVIYGSLVVSCLFLPRWVIEHVGCKWTVVFSMVCYIAYMAANFYAVWGTMIPGAIILGLGAAPLWSAKCTYLTETGTWYAKMTGATPDAIINRFFGIFFLIFQTSQIWGNLISSLVFSQKEGKNDTKYVTEEELQLCGANECPAESSGNNTSKPDMDKIYTVCGIYIACACVAVIIVAVLLDKIVLDREENEQEKEKSKKGGKLSFHLLLETFLHIWRSPYQKLLVPITIYSGVEQAFIAGDFTRSYVTCALGIWNVGFVMICYGVVDASCSFAFGRMVQFVGHIPFFVLAFVLHLACQITLLLWLPDPDAIYVFYILAGLWGMGDAVIQTQINALYGYLFVDNPEAAFANYRLWESLGFIFAFAYSHYLCTDIKLYICIGVLSVGMLLYGACEVLHRRRNSRSFDL